MSVAWPGVSQLGWGTKAEGLAALLGALGTVGLLATGKGGGGGGEVVCLLSCSIAELILVVQHDGWCGTLFGGAGLWCVSGLGWGVPDRVKNVLIFLSELKISLVNSVQMRVPLWLAFL